MYIDGRDIDIEALLTKVRDIIRAQEAGCADMDVFVVERHHAAKVKAFVSMTGCDVSVHKKDDGYLVSVSGGSCNACR